MPHIEIKCFPGRTEDVKQACADKVAAIVAETLGCNTTALPRADHGRSGCSVY